ncbi:MAG: MAPEG family protein [Alphaproteobacteria bacterium]|nr:MAPEG family protein [Alphaproteobacteria bacterium]
MNLVNWQIAPLLVHFLLTVTVGLTMLQTRIAAARSGQTRLADVALSTAAWPERSRQFSNNFDNQFQLPMVWYGLTALLVATGKLDGVTVALSWAFVAARGVHTFIHVTINNVVRRLFAYLAGFTALFALWGWFALRLFVLG